MNANETQNSFFIKPGFRFTAKISKLNIHNLKTAEFYSGLEKTILINHQLRMNNLIPFGF
jgi:hypothetical protein